SMKDKLILNMLRDKTNLPLEKLQLISEIRSLSADCLPSLIKASACGVSASQLFSRSVANFFNPIRITGKSMKDKLILNMLRDKTNLPLEKLQLISEIRSLSADCLPSLIKACIQRGLG
ncbi:hypothetical protein MZM54_15150, partial [[Brevibacterium] frigoritolerans]|nr:hypothetical protein [Peribacillus frigoritolerans]